MKTNVNLWWILAGFFLLCAALYTGWSIIEHSSLPWYNAIEWVGSVALVFVTMMAAMIAFYTARVQKAQGGLLPEDSLTADIDDGDPEMGEFSPWSWWPLVLAGSAALAFIGLALQFTSTLSAITEGAMGLETRRPLLDSIDGVLTAEPLAEPDTAARLTAPGSVELRGVTFGYTPDAPVVRDLSFEVPTGSMVALVGPSGSGKTTVEKLISRFHDVDSGEVFVGGVPVTRQTTEQLMAQLSMVFQDVYLFDDTLEANIAVGREGASTAEIRHAAELAGVTEIAARLPEGWATQVGEGGKALSGGERQRVAIARALLKQAPVVLLDEATSALDVENEAHIVASVEQLRKDATLLVVAHRLDTIAKADSIVLLTADGQIEAQGTHEEDLVRVLVPPCPWRSDGAGGDRRRVGLGHLVDVASGAAYPMTQSTCPMPAAGFPSRGTADWNL